jgi:zinc protease
MPQFRRLAFALLFVLTFVITSSHAAEKSDIAPVQFTEETLDNGLHVIYAPLKESPVVHVRVLYHVGSRDERPDRQGFAHMFEHMMFRGSAHVKPEEHMKLVGMVGGMSNAFTSFDQTTYINTVPANHLPMVLWLEADRMSSFKVSADIYRTERLVVAEEWRMRNMNQPYGTQMQDFLKLAFTKSNYRWTPIGDMNDLLKARPSELQEFFNKWYTPDNATLIIAGNINVDETKELVRKDFGWIPKSEQKPVRPNVTEPPHDEPRREVQYQKVPLPAIVIGWQTPVYTSDDHYALTLLGMILGSGRTSRLDQALVSSQDPLAVEADAGEWQLEDNGIFIASAKALPGKSTEAVEKELNNVVTTLIEKGVTEDELDKAKTQMRTSIINGRKTATDVASILGEEAVFGKDANRVNTAMDRFNAVTVADIQAMAKKYLAHDRSSTLYIIPDPKGEHAKAAATQAAAMKSATVAASTEPIKPRVVNFPSDYPTSPPMADIAKAPEFEKGTKSEVNGVQVIVMPDHRLPLVDWSLTMRRGSDAVPKEKQGLSGITAAMLRRGVKGMSYQELSTDLESRGIDIGVSDGGDFMRLGGSCTTDQLEHGIERSRQILLEPTFPEDEFKKLMAQSIADLADRLARPGPVASRELDFALYGDSPLGRYVTRETLQSITLDDVKNYYKEVFQPKDAIFIISGDVSPEQGKALAEKMLAGWKGTDLPPVDYTLPAPAKKRHIILVDNTEGKQSTIYIGSRAFDIHNDDKFAGSVAGRILSDGIDSRLGKYVRAEKGYVYGVFGYFRPDRHGGAFMAQTDTKMETTADTIEAIFKVLNDMRSANVTDKELKEAQMRVAGGMAMEMQTIEQQAGRRVEGILNDYPIDYYDKYPARIAQVTADQVRDVMNKYVDPDEMTIVVVAPASEVKPQLEKLGEVEVMPMPMQRGATTQPTTPAKKAA